MRIRTLCPNPVIEHQTPPGVCLFLNPYASLLAIPYGLDEIAKSLEGTGVYLQDVVLRWGSEPENALPSVAS